MEENSSCQTDQFGTCITCSDQGLLGKVLRVDTANAAAEVSFDQGTQTVDISLIPDVMPGQTLLVHAKMAIARPEGAGSE